MATKILKDYMIKGFAIDVEKMKNAPKFGKDYYDELLQTIKEIRLSDPRKCDASKLKTVIRHPVKKIK